MGEGRSGALVTEDGDRNTEHLAQHERNALIFSIFAGLAVAILGAAVLISWAARFEPVLLVKSSLPPMVPTTALSLVLIGTSLALTSYSERPGPTRVARALAAVAVSVSVLALLEHLFGFRTPIFSFLVDPSVGTAGTAQTGQLSVHVAATLLACALTLVCLDVDAAKGNRVAVALGLFATCLSLVAVFGFLFGLHYLYGGAARGGMAVHTAGGLLLLSTGILCCRPARFPVKTFTSEGPGGVLARRLIPALIATPFLFAVLRSAGERMHWFMPNVSLAVATTVGTVILVMLLAFVANAMDRNDEHRSRAEGRFLAAFVNAANGLIIVDLKDDGSAIAMEVNPALLRLLRRPSSAILGHDFREVIDFQHRDMMKPLFDDLDALPEGLAIAEIPMVRGDGTLLWTSLTASLVDRREAKANHALLQVNDVTHSREVKEHLEHLAHHDSLTGLFNRRRFEEELCRHIDSCRRYGPTGALAMVDLDNFKEVNDTLGHGAGDRVIRKVARVIDDRLRSTDIVARLGGDEFAILFARGSAEETERVCTELVGLIERGILDEHLSVPVTCSMGLTAFVHDRLNVDEVLMESDVALYEAKESGKARVVAYNVALASRTYGLSIAQRLRTAITEGLFRLEFQPVVDLRNRAVAQMEVLLRIDDGGPDIPADTLFSVARRLGLAVELDHWVLRTSLAGPDPLLAVPGDGMLSLNLSSDSVADRNAPEWISKLVRDSGVEPGRLIFEISESDAISHLDRAAQLALALHDVGCRVAVDDFGSALMSLAELHRIAFDFVKLDGSLVHDLVHSPQNQAVIRAVSEMAGNLGQLTIGELVEDEDTARLLCKLGVRYGQGFHIGTPAAATTVS